MSELTIVDRLGLVRDGGSCSVCDGDYTGSPYSWERGVRVLASSEPGIVEPYNMCPSCYDRLETRSESTEVTR